MECNDIEAILKLAINNLFKHQPDINDFTPETGQTEWNIAHHLANEIAKFFPGYACDLDVTKKNYDNRRPDIIFHYRGSQENNLLVVELKRDGSSRDRDNDIEKIKRDWFDHPLSYQFGATINLRFDDYPEVLVFENERNVKLYYRE